MDPVSNNSALVYLMVCRRICDKPLAGPGISNILTTCVNLHKTV